MQKAASIYATFTMGQTSPRKASYLETKESVLPELLDRYGAKSHSPCNSLKL